MQAGCSLSAAGLRVLYIAVKNQLNRLSYVHSVWLKHLIVIFLLSIEIDVQTIVNHIHALSPDVVIIDSIQVVHLAEITSSPGSVSQVRESAAVLTHLAKITGFSLFLVGHVTKGDVSWPACFKAHG